MVTFFANISLNMFPNLLKHNIFPCSIEANCLAMGFLSFSGHRHSSFCIDNPLIINTYAAWSIWNEAWIVPCCYHTFEFCCVLISPI